MLVAKVRNAGCTCSIALSWPMAGLRPALTVSLLSFGQMLRSFGSAERQKYMFSVPQGKSGLQKLMGPSAGIDQA